MIKGNCVHHDGFIYDVASPDLARHLPHEVAYILNKLESDLINNPERREELEREKNRFKWICCDSTVTAGSSGGGCKKGKHHCIEQMRDKQQRRGGRHLDRGLIRQWEEECRSNPEYNEKWLDLLERRAIMNQD